MSKEITYEPINFRRLSDASSMSRVSSIQKENKNVELLADVALSGVTHKHKMFRYIRNTVIVAAVAFTILFRYTIVSDNTSKLSSLKKEYTELAESNINLQCEIDSRTDSDSIELAAEKLGMAKPSKSQKVSVDVRGGDYVEVSKPRQTNSGEGSQFYATMIETLGNVLEYLY